MTPVDQRGWHCTADGRSLYSRVDIDGPGGGGHRVEYDGGALLGA
jgi:hypothetical protein